MSQIDCILHLRSVLLPAQTPLTHGSLLEYHIWDALSHLLVAQPLIGLLLHKSNAINIMILQRDLQFEKAQRSNSCRKQMRNLLGNKINTLVMIGNTPYNGQMIIDYTIYKLAMQQQAMRNSFEVQYQPNIHHIAPEAHPQEHRLSSGKQSLLESFKESVMEEASSPSANYHLSYLEEYQNEVKYQKDLPIAEIREESNESEEKSDLHSEQRGKNPYLVESPRRTRVSSHEEKPNEPGSNLQNNLKTLVSITSSQCPKTQLLCLIGEAVKYLGKGIEVMRYCFGAQKIERSILCFSQDFDFFSLVYDRSMKVYTTKDCIHILIGVKTQRFQHYQTRGYEIPEETSFSLQFQQRSFDFQTKTPQSRDQLIKHLRLLRECY